MLIIGDMDENKRLNYICNSPPFPFHQALSLKGVSLNLTSSLPYYYLTSARNLTLLEFSLPSNTTALQVLSSNVFL